MFLNTLISTTQIDRQKTFDNYIVAIRDQMNAILTHQEYPYEKLYEEIRRLNGYQGKSLFSIMFNYMPYQEEVVFNLDKITAKPYEFEESIPKYDLGMYMIEHKSKIKLIAVYKSSIDEYMIDNILTGFQTILDIVIDNPKILLRDVHLNIETEVTYSGGFEEEFKNDDLFE
jgi:non-ribosomal peptide synthetase component F